MYTMMQVCREVGMTYQTLKFYCNEGLVPNVKRDKNNRRIFDEKDIKWINDLTCLKRCSMSIQEMKEYLDLCLQGASTIPLRKELLAKKQEALRLSIKELENSVSYIDWKQNFYDEVLSGKRPFPQVGDGRRPRAAWRNRFRRQSAGAFLCRSDWSVYIPRTGFQKDCRGRCGYPARSDGRRFGGRTSRSENSDRSWE